VAVFWRNELETRFDYLTTYPAKISEWKDADKKKRMAEFGPAFIRNALDKRDNYTSGARKKIYDSISEAATHASYRGFSLFMNDQNLGEIGPFYNERKLSAWLGEGVSNSRVIASICAKFGKPASLPRC
jgi:hypothetical protein